MQLGEHTVHGSEYYKYSPCLTLLKLDCSLHPVSSPIIDSHDLLARMPSHFNTHHENDWVCTTIDFCAMYTRVT